MQDNTRQGFYTISMLGSVQMILPTAPLWQWAFEQFAPSRLFSEGRAMQTPQTLHLTRMASNCNCIIHVALLPHSFYVCKVLVGLDGESFPYIFNRTLNNEIIEQKYCIKADCMTLCEHDF